MAKLIFTIEATLPEFSSYADRLGYMREVVTGVDAEGKDIVVTNHESKKDYLTRILKDRLSEVLYQPLVNDIEKAVRDTREAEKEAVRDNIRSRVTVSVK